MDAWFSGLLPYPVLLPIQIVIVPGQAVISRDVWRGSGCFVRRRPRARRRLQWLASSGQETAGAVVGVGVRREVTGSSRMASARPAAINPMIAADTNAIS
jgi:hypothetical protein